MYATAMFWIWRKENQFVDFFPFDNILLLHPTSLKDDLSDSELENCGRISFHLRSSYIMCSDKYIGPVE